MGEEEVVGGASVPPLLLLLKSNDFLRAEKAVSADKETTRLTERSLELPLAGNGSSPPRSPGGCRCVRPRGCKRTDHCVLFDWFEPLLPGLPQVLGSVLLLCLVRDGAVRIPE